MFEPSDKPKKVKVLKKISKVRLKNIALYYLRRFESSTDNLRRVLQKRINDYGRQNPEFDREEALGWAEEILNDFQRFGYVDDKRFAEIRVRDYIKAGKSVRYIKGKLREKGIAEEIISGALEDYQYDEYETALILAKKKRIGPFRATEEDRFNYRTKDIGTLSRAGFSYDVVQRVMGFAAEGDESVIDDFAEI